MCNYIVTFYTFLNLSLISLYIFFNSKCFQFNTFVRNTNMYNHPLDNQTKPLISHSEKYACRDTTPMWRHSRSEPSMTYRFVREMQNQRKNKFCWFILENKVQTWLWLMIFSASQETPTSLFHSIPRYTYFLFENMFYITFSYIRNKEK